MQSYLVRNLRSALWWITLCPIACGTVDGGVVDSGSAGTVHTSTAPIINGEDSPATENAVVQVLAIKDGIIELSTGGSGSLVAPNLVLTARHVVAELRQMEDMIDCRPGETEVLFGANRPLDTIGVFVDRVNRKVSTSVEGMYRVKEIIGGDSNRFCDSDLAFLILDRPVPDVEPLALRLSGPPSELEAVSMVGYGHSSVILDYPKVRQRVDSLKINRYVPLNGIQSEIGEGTGTALIDVLDRAPCSGDSGGPVLSKHLGILAVISFIYKSTNEVDILRPNAGCLNSTVMAHTVYDRLEFVQTAFKKAGYSPTEEQQVIDPGPDAAAGVPLGGSCEKGVDCASNQCVEIAGAGVCVTDCTNAPCPEGFWCSSVGQTGKSCLQESQPSDRGGGCSFFVGESNSPVQSPHASVVLLVGLACMRRRRQPYSRSP
jgi:hypothetical protein